MKKKICVSAVCLAMYAASCMGQVVQNDGFAQLCEVYRHATMTLNKVKTVDESGSALDSLALLLRNNKDNPAILQVLRWSYDTCPKEKRGAYEKALRVQAEMKDAIKRLAMSGALQSEKIGTAVNQFAKTFAIRGYVYDERVGNEGAPAETKKARDKRMKWWRDGKFGMFIHYGLYSGLAGEFQGKKYEGCVEWIQMQSGADFETYKKEAIPRFNPKSGKAAEWVKLAKEAGCSYTVLTSRHHEGFNMFETPSYSFNVKQVKGIDVVKEYSEACKKYHMKAGYYFSLLDWNHPDYDPSGSGISYPAGNYIAQQQGKREFGHHDRYKKYLSDIFGVLLNNYKVDLVWWDFSQPRFQGDYAWGATHLMKQLFDKYPNAIQNNRLYHSDNHLSEGGIKVTPVWKGDYSTAEHHIPAKGIDGDWEACQTLNGTWGYSASNQRWKTVKELVHELVDVVSRGGNFLLNIGPMPDGSIPKESVALFKGIGKWMKENGEAIYGTRANPFDVEFPWGRITRKGDNTLYLLIYQLPESGKISIPCKFKGKAVATMLKNKQKVALSQSEKECVINLSGMPMDEVATVVRLKGKWESLIP